MIGLSPSSPSSRNGNNIFFLLPLVLLSTIITPTNAIRIHPNDVLLNATAIGNHRQSRNLMSSGSGSKVNVPTATSPNDHLVTNLPLLDNAKFPTQHWAGLLPASDDGHKYFFYWLFAPSGEQITSPEAAALDTTIPLLVWLNGGPACSSMDGLWLENGPFRLTENTDSDNSWSIEIDQFSWHTAPAYVVYIDQPVGTGLSFTTNGKYPRNDVEVNVDFYYFFQEFLKLHGDKFVDETITLKRPLYFSGESHAGHYIPSMMNYIHQQNVANTDMSRITAPLSGGAIGNGWFDPPHQYSAHQVAYGYGMVGLSQVRALEAQEKLCQQDLAKGKYTSGICFDLLNQVVDNSAGKGSGLVASQYDQRKWEVEHKPRDFPPGHQDVESYLGQSSHSKALSALTMDVLEAIHATPSWESGQRYRECTDPPYNALKHQDGLGVTQDVIALLNADIQLLFFNGIHDLICNHVGNEIALEHLDWKSRDGYLIAQRYGWFAKTTGSLAGYMKQYNSLSFLKVLDSGHMVPMDLPEISLEMMSTFMYNGVFTSYEQQITRQKDENNKNANCPVCPAVSPIAPPPPSDSCPECEECSTSSTSSSSSSENADSQPEDTNMIQVPIEVVGVASLMIVILGLTTLCACCYCCFCRSKSGSGHRRLSKPQYDVELSRSSNGGGYTDNFEDDDDDDDKIPMGEIS